MTDQSAVDKYHGAMVRHPVGRSVTVSETPFRILDFGGRGAGGRGRGELVVPSLQVAGPV